MLFVRVIQKRKLKFYKLTQDGGVLLYQRYSVACGHPYKLNASAITFSKFKFFRFFKFNHIFKFMEFNNLLPQPDCSNCIEEIGFFVTLFAAYGCYLKCLLF